MIFSFIYTLDSTSIEYNRHNNSINLLVKTKTKLDNTKVLNDKQDSIFKDNATSMKSLIENIKTCDIVGNNNCIEPCVSDKQEEFNHCCTNGNSKEALFDLHFSNLNDIVLVEKEKCKKKVYQFIQYLKTELEKFNDVLIDQPVVKHVAHLEIEASKKKNLENFVAEFEGSRINSPNPFLFVADLKTFTCSFDQL